MRRRAVGQQKYVVSEQTRQGSFAFVVTLCYPLHIFFKKQYLFCNVHDPTYIYLASLCLAQRLAINSSRFQNSEALLFVTVFKSLTSKLFIFGFFAICTVVIYTYEKNLHWDMPPVQIVKGSMEQFQNDMQIGIIQSVLPFLLGIYTVLVQILNLICLFLK